MLRLGKLTSADSALFICDIQEKFVPLIHRMETVVMHSRRMIQAANELKLPMVVTEQYPKGLGETVHELKEVLPKDLKIFEKTKFSMMIQETEEALNKLKHIKNILLVGIEAHVCILQTALDLIEKNYNVHVIVDCVSSQRERDRSVALNRISQSGAFLTNTEMIMFQLLGDAKHPSFKAISALAKERTDASLFHI